MNTAIQEGKAMAGNEENGGGQRANHWRIAAWTFAALILMLPLIAMQFTKEVNWSMGDFTFAAFLLFGSLGAYELAIRKTANAAYKAGVSLALAAAFILVWVNGAVGIIGNEGNNANLMYYGVLAVGVIGALLARFEPKGMSRAMIATAVAQGLVFVIALVAGWGFTGPITLLFLALWLGSAQLFNKAAGGDPEQGAD